MPVMNFRICSVSTIIPLRTVNGQSGVAKKCPCIDDTMSFFIIHLGGDVVRI